MRARTRTRAGRRSSGAGGYGGDDSVVVGRNNCMKGYIVILILEPIGIGQDNRQGMCSPPIR